MFFSLKIALSSLKTHRLRTALAVMGVLLGALALTGVQSISQAMYAKAEAETAKLGTNLLMARSGQVRFGRDGGGRVRGEAKTFTLGDARALIGGLPAARLGAPFVNATMPVRYGNTKVPSQLIASTPEYADIRNLQLAAGRFFSAAEEASQERVVVLGAKIASRLFPRPEAALGETVLMFRAPVRVIGVLATMGADIVGSDQDEQVLVPLSTYQRRFANQETLSGVYIQLATPQDEAESKLAATEILRRRHQIGPGQREDFSVVTARDTIQLQEQALDLVQTLGLISSSISFAVGGLGILSIMVLLVRTRRLEIGIRRAVGAKRFDIIRQFILEAALMAGIGGLLGVLCAEGLVVVVTRFAKMPLVFDPLLMAGTFLGSLLLGLAAGAYPAWQAAHIEVLEVLRNE
ncbi:ABC transporter permease [Desulfuromonas carbonis]|uniref:ABC transporter permease n=1 Tax=Desulfuromonas sp. DDH964 TaxID=1823759 RepID=UPI00078C4308|nr:ABC transporter permease [Desulfuromonas sp. DDH964]AMV73296.1 ABC transporter membrane protein [Desulfuromonas sp. DDH964]